MTIWERYTNYLIEWAVSHKEEVFAGMAPACFDEWLENEYEERQTINIRSFAADIVDVFEDLLKKHNIKIPNDDRLGEECEACIYGDDYYSAEDDVTEMLSGICAIIKETPKIEVLTSYDDDE